jgi:hypothetical protein
MAATSPVVPGQDERYRPARRETLTRFTHPLGERQDFGQNPLRHNALPGPTAPQRNLMKYIRRKTARPGFAGAGTSGMRELGHPR